MKKYQLTEKQSEGKHTFPKINDVYKRFFFRGKDYDRSALRSQVDYMIEHGLCEMDLWLAKREIKSSYFFCKHFGEVGNKTEGVCGKSCEGYKPRNGKSGVCFHYGYTYEQTNECFTVKIN